MHKKICYKYIYYNKNKGKNKYKEFFMDYDKIKLGFIDRFKVWKLRREIRQYSEWRDEMEGGFSYA